MYTQLLIKRWMDKHSKRKLLFVTLVLSTVTGEQLRSLSWFPSKSCDQSLWLGSLSLSVGPGVFPTSTKANDSNHLYGWSSNRSHCVWWPVWQVILNPLVFKTLFHQKKKKHSLVWHWPLCFTGKVCIILSNAFSISQVWETHHPDLVLPAACGARL